METKNTQESGLYLFAKDGKLYISNHCSDYYKVVNANDVCVNTENISEVITNNQE